MLRVVPAALPSLSVGNLSVGGTGKTPVAAWFAEKLRLAGARPVVVLRGYGDDEPAVHAVLNPSVPVLVDADRARALRRAGAEGCDVAVLDDAFQHRRLSRTADVVLVSADRWDASPRLLPAGPWREPLSARSRATIVMVTRKAAEPAAAAALALHLAGRTGEGRVVVAVLRLEGLVPLTAPEPGGAATATLAELRGARVVAVSGVADPAAFHAQLSAAGAAVVPVTFADHHRYTASDVGRILSAARGADGLVCTLKDAVKLRALWPRAGCPAWYVSLRCEIDSGRDALTAVVDRLLAARHATTPG